MSASAPLAEVFTSFQGEGPLVGVRQLFVRVRGCDLTCRYCDTAAARELDGPCRIEVAPGSGEFAEHGGPFSAEQVLASSVGRYGAAQLHSLALTGGEPLLYPEFVRELAVSSPVPLYLEAAGHKPDELAHVIGVVQFVSLDYKLPTTLLNPVDPALFVRSYEIAGDKTVAVKLVVTAETTEAEVGEACRKLASVSPRGPVVLQPVTRLAGGPEPPGAAQLHGLHCAAGAWMDDVRVIPQTHRVMGVL
jgi:7-carboxy-7-deazaguanine synthase